MPDSTALATALDRVLTLEIVRVTEQAAVAAALLRGRGDEFAADHAAVRAMHDGLAHLAIDGVVVIGEGEPGMADELFIGETIGTGDGPAVDIALDPLEGTTICAKNLPNSLSVMAVAERGSLLKTPDVYMEKIAIGPGYPDEVVDLTMPPAEAIRALAKAKGVGPQEISACILDRPRHARLIEEVRSTGAAIRLIGDGDIAGVIHTTDSDETGIDIYLGVGGAPEGVLAAAALRCTGGQMQGRLMLTSDEQRERAHRLGITDIRKIYSATDMASGDVLFAATGVTDGNLLDGVKFLNTGAVETETVVMRSATQTLRWIRAMHKQRDKFLRD